MNSKIKSKLFAYLIFFIIVSICASIYSLLIYYNKVDSNIKSFNIYTFIIGIFCFFILGFVSGNVADKNGLLEGLIAALVIILIALVINFFIQVPFITKSFIKIVSYISSSSLGGIIGVNLKSPFKSKEHL